MRTDTKKFKVLQFICSKRGVTSTEVAKFIVQDLNGKTWDSKRGCGMWNITLYGKGYAKPGLYKEFCRKVNGLWYLTESAKTVVMLALNAQAEHKKWEHEWQPLVDPTFSDKFDRWNMQEKFEDVFPKAMLKQAAPPATPEPVVRLGVDGLIQRLQEAQEVWDEALAEREMYEKMLIDVTNNLTAVKNKAKKALTAVEEAATAVKEFLRID